MKVYMKKSVMYSLLIATLTISLFSAIDMIQFAYANPLPFWERPVERGTVPPDRKTNPPIVAIFFPSNSNYRSNSFSIPIHAQVGDSSTAYSIRLDKVYYECDWQTNITFVYVAGVTDHQDPVYFNPITELLTTINITDVPEGRHSIRVFANETGTYRIQRHSNSSIYTFNDLYAFEMTRFAFVTFNIDTTPPALSNFSIENKTYNSTELPLSLNVDDPDSKITYSLDGQRNITITRNITLTNLTIGTHDIIAYATDSFGNVGYQEAVFTVAQPAPTINVLEAASVAAIGIILVCSGFFVYKKKNSILQKFISKQA